jgi:hypothetical protein
MNVDDDQDRRQAYMNVRDQVGYCGIWCGSCIVGNGTLSEMTKRYRQMIAAYGLKEWAPGDFDYDEFSRGLESIQNMEACPGCLKGGGRDACELRACASTKGLASCVACSEFGECEHNELLSTMRSGAIDAGLCVRAEKSEPQGSLEEWEDQLRQSWPCSILFREDV